MGIIRTISGLGSCIYLTKEALESTNPVIPLGVIAYETDSRRSKIGDGITPYNKLYYSSGDVEFSGKGRAVNNINIQHFIPE